eukprot:scaffold6137_cov147-Isochrysis_galbana.AAC.1
MDDLLDRGDYDDGDVSDLEQLDSSEEEGTRAPDAPTRNPFAAGNEQRKRYSLAATWLDTSVLLVGVPHSSPE